MTALLPAEVFNPKDPIEADVRTWKPGSDRKVRVLEPCCGCGGMVLGMKMAFPNAEFVCLDIMTDALKTLHHNMKKQDVQVIRGDMRHLPLRGNARFDIVAGGPPCQGFSLAAQPQRKNSPRAAARHKILRDLTFVFGDIVMAYQPEAFIMENVPQILTAENGRYWTQLRDMLEQTYFVTVVNLNAADYGVPQWRQRVIFMGSVYKPPDPPEVTHHGFCPKCGTVCYHTYYTAEPGLCEGIYYCRNNHTFLRANLLESQPGAACEQCGEKKIEDARYCIKCGEKFPLEVLT